jgi:sec-independent protein translocase protein TatA
MLRLGPVELLIILAIVVLIFGVGRIGKIGKELGTGMREFRKGLQGEDQNKPIEPPADDQPPES